MKQLKFSEPLPKLILEGEKDTTWRINDKQSIEFGDALSLSVTMMERNLPKRRLFRQD
ncbi:MAG: hypothetical protein QGH47_03490 [Candidatus Woesearchaeota archaeon]|jgi:hypothetical protein|nr:hypothetical protein [Candidatus Woesearchaeota archaeon]